MLKHFRTKSSHTYRKCDCAAVNSRRNAYNCFVDRKQHSNSSNTNEQIKRNFLYFSRMAQQRGFRQRNCCRALANRENKRFSCYSSDVQQSCSGAKKWAGWNFKQHVYVICRRAFDAVRHEKRWSCLSMKMKFRQVVCVYRCVHQELWQRCISLSVGFHFLLVKYVLKCGVDHTWKHTSASLIYEHYKLLCKAK